MRTNTLTIKPLIYSRHCVDYMVGSLDTTHGQYHVSVSEGKTHRFLVTLTKKGVIYAKVFGTMSDVMDAILTFMDNDERFSKVTD